MAITFIVTELGVLIDTEDGRDLVTEDSVVPATGGDDKIVMGFRQGTQQAEVVMGGFG